MGIHNAYPKMGLVVVALTQRTLGHVHLTPSVSFLRGCPNTCKIGSLKAPSPMA
jgi:hypothetical protein